MVFVALVMLWCAAIVAAPLLSFSAGISHAAGSFIYEGFSRICHQMDERSFHLAGLKLGVCIRCSSMYFGFLATLILLLVFSPLQRIRIPSIRWLLAAFAPMLIDVVLNDTGIRLSTSTSRLITGVIVGAVLPLYVVPSLLEAVAQIKLPSLNLGGFYARKTQ